MTFSPETLFIWGILLSTLFYTRLVLDYTLMPRFLFLSISLLSILVGLLVKSREYFRIRFDIILLSYFLYVMVNCTSVLWAQNLSMAIFDSSKLVLGFGVFILAVSFVSGKPALFGKLGKVALILFFVSMLVALFQFLEIKKIDRESIYHIIGINSHKNLFSSFLFLLLFFCISSAVYFRKVWRIVFIIASSLNIIILIILQTRAVWVGLFASLIVFTVIVIFKSYIGSVFKRNRVYLCLIGAVILLIFGFLFIFPPVADKLAATMPNAPGGTLLESSSGVERLIIWNKTFQTIKEHFVMGVGAGNWQVYFPNNTLSGLWRVEDLNVTFQRPHNDFLWILSETGIIGFSLFLIFIMGLLIFTLTTFAHSNDLKQRLICGLLVSFTIGFMVISFLDFPKERIEHTIWANIIYALSYVMIKDANVTHTLFQLKIKRWMIAFPLLLVTFIVVIGYLRFKGESNTRMMYVFRDHHEWKSVKLACDHACSFAYTLDPTSVPLNWYKGNAEVSLQDYDGALNSLLLAKEHHPYNRNVLNDLGSAYVMNGNIEAAMISYKEAARISPRYDDPRLNLVSLLISNSNWKEAACWEKSIKHESERRSYYRKLITENTKE